MYPLLLKWFVYKWFVYKWFVMVCLYGLHIEMQRGTLVSVGTKYTSQPVSKHSFPTFHVNKTTT